MLFEFILLFVVVTLAALGYPIYKSVKLRLDITKEEKAFRGDFWGIAREILNQQIIPHCTRLFGMGAIVNNDKSFIDAQKAGGRIALTTVLSILEAGNDQR